MGRKWLCGNFFNATNNRAENMNSKLKQLVERFSSLEMFVERFFTMIHAQRNEKKHKAAVMLQKQRVDTASDEASKLYSKLLTPYAFNRVKEELCEATQKMSVDALADAHRFSATARGCTCAFRQAMLLPCRHNFTVGDHLSISKFEKDVCAKRWFLDVYVQSCGLTQNNECAGEELVQVSSRKDERILSAHQKFRKAAAIASTLADLASDCATPRLKERLKVLESILQSCRHNVEVTVTSCAPCTSNGVDTQSECLLDQVSQAAAGEGAQDSAELSDHSKQNCASRDVTQRRGAAGDCVTEGHSTQISDALAKIKVPVTKKSCGRPKRQMVPVIGLPRKRKRTSTERPYAELTMKEKK